MDACYTLSHFLQASDFGDATIDTFTRRMEIRSDSPLDLAKWIYIRTTKDSAHRKLCSDIVVSTWDRKTFNRLWTEDHPREFLDNILADVSEKLERGVKRRDVAKILSQGRITSIMSTNGSRYRAISRDFGY
jgi:hypothetical protein